MNSREDPRIGFRYMHPAIKDVVYEVVAIDTNKGKAVIGDIHKTEVTLTVSIANLKNGYRRVK